MFLLFMFLFFLVGYITNFQWVESKNSSIKLKMIKDSVWNSIRFCGSRITDSFKFSKSCSSISSSQVSEAVVSRSCFMAGAL